MFDPLANASCVARFLRELHDERGDWLAAAGAYHSRTPEHATRYRAAFDAHRATAAHEGRIDVSTVVAQAPVPRANTFPLLTEPDGAPRLGSLVPTDG